MKRICFLHHTYPGIGGTETVTNLLSACYADKGISTSVIAWQKPVNQLFSPLNIVYLPDETDINSDLNNQFIKLYVIENEIDCLINQGPFWIPSAEFKHINTVILSVLHYSPYYKIENQKNAIIDKYNKQSKKPSHRIKSIIRYWFRDFFAQRDFNKIYKEDLNRTVVNSDGFVLLCPEYVEEFQLLMGVSYNNLYSIENGIKLSESQVSRRKAKMVVCVGRLTKWDKRVDRLLRIWKDVQKDFPDWELLILGDGPERENLQELALSLGLRNCKFLGFVNIHDHLPHASILAMTSSSEGFPMVILEGYAYGVVPIAYEVSGGISHLIDDGETGILVKPFNHDDYASKLKMLIGSPRTVQQMSDDGMQKVNDYDINKIANDYLDLINSLLQAKNNNRQQMCD